MRTIEAIKADLAKPFDYTDKCELEYELRNALFVDIPLDRLEEICAAEQDWRCMVLPCKVGDTVWIIERDECGEATEYCGYMFLAVSAGTVIVSSFIDDFETSEETIDYHISETAENCYTSLYVFPSEDCCLTREEAEAKLTRT